MKREEEIRLRADEYAKETWAIGTPYSGFIAGVLWADSHPQWISVADRLPEENKNVFLFSKETGNAIGKYNNGAFFTEMSIRSNGNKELGTYVEFSYKVVNLNVTHWMPLPEPPQTEE